MKALLILTAVFTLLTTVLSVVQENCVPLGGNCTKTVFSRCCGDAVCDLRGPFNGICVACYELEHGCLSDDECCSKRCHWFQCKPKE
ncbi:hypothetical protein CSKR_110109 [Clonorchis sinensis]|uniref:Uncharacterized protein n=2 Tax=Clonorchis sinensis TaxID=79923 RepID=A0A8T1MN51_CLOSI|nr:hypothetical protein CSKR_110109 [Clonorchis sinensis]GAA52628.1 hypothetical protein CLF_108476 [Clonorchis sinensis]